MDFKDKQFSVDEILDLPQNIAKERHKRVVVCIDEFQNICEFDNTLDFQKKLRSHWQKHTSVCYCLYGSKRHMLLDIFGNDDFSPTPADVNVVEDRLKACGKNYEFHRYDGAGHGIWYYDKPMYRQEQAMDSFNKTITFFDKYLK